MKVYELLHSRVVDQCEDGSKIYDTKCVGYFSDLSIVNRTIKDYQKITGFKDYPNDFTVCEHVVSGENVSSVFVLFHEYYVPKGDYDEVACLGLFVTKEEAETALNTYKRSLKYAGCPDGFSIDEYRINELNWIEGFISNKV